jgi:predicted double-glycine peptidase
MVGYSHDRSYEYSYIAERIKITGKGASFLDIQRFFEAEGFLVEGFRNGVDSLQDASGNIIAAVHPRHFVVVEAFLPDGTLIVKDPSAGLIRVPRWAFRLWWRGAYLRVTSQAGSAPVPA